MARVRWPIRLMCLTITAAVAATCSAQQKPPVTAFVLEKIVSSPSRLPLPSGNEGVSHAIADLDGGLVRFRREHNYGKSVPCVKEYEFAWSFDRDIHVVKPGEGFEVSMKGSSRHVSGECPDWISVRVIFGGGKTKAMGTLPESALDRRILDSMFPQGTEETMTVYGDAVLQTGTARREPTEGKTVVKFTSIMRGHDYVYIGGIFPSQTNPADYWQILYIYRAVREGEPIPPRREVAVDAPRPDRNPDTIGRGDTASERPAADSTITGRPDQSSTQQPADTTTLDPVRPPVTDSLPPGANTSSGNTPGDTSPATPTSRGTTTGGGITSGTGVGARDPSGILVTGTTGRAIIADRRLVEQGQILYLPVFIRDPGGVANLNFDLIFDPSVAVVEGNPAQGNVLQGAIFQANAQQSGIVRVGIAGTQGIQRTGIIVNIPFRAVGSPGDVTAVTPKVTTIAGTDGDPLTIAEVVGEVRIAAPGGGLVGDCDGDGILSAADALCALKMSVGLLDPRPVMDVDRDGQVTSSDARVILQQAR